MKTTNYTISDIANAEWKAFALYTIENRAIPSICDGLKPSQRMYLYSSLVNSMKEFKKVSAVAGIVSDYGYNHGEASVASTGQLMAAEWNNNLCLVEGRGSFGTRLIQEAGAPRYVYTRVHSNFHKYVKDIELSPAHTDPEHIPPQYYLPVIPLVIVNGSKGIATGFATNILPRSVASVKSACSEYIKTGKIKNRLEISFPQFKGTVVYDPVLDKYSCIGTFTRQGKTKLTITEVPYGFDRESYIKILDSLEDAGDIVSYEDKCNANGFAFDVKLKSHSAEWNNDKIIKEFKLAKSHTENLTVIDQHGKLREYKDERDLIKDFCDFRITILQKRIDRNIEIATEESRWLNVKMEFILGVLNGKIVFKNNKKDVVIEHIVKHTAALPKDYTRLFNINLLSLTLEQVDDLKKQVDDCQTKIKYWKSTTPKDQFILDLQGI